MFFKYFSLQCQVQALLKKLKQTKVKDYFEVKKRETDSDSDYSDTDTECKFLRVKCRNVIYDDDSGSDSNVKQYIIGIVIHRQ